MTRKGKVFIITIAKDCLPTGQEQACTRISRLFVCLFVRYHVENGPIHRKMVVDCPLVITSKVNPFSRPYQTRNVELLVKSVFCIVGTGSSFAVNQNGKFGGGGQKDLHAGRSGKMRTRVSDQIVTVILLAHRGRGFTQTQGSKPHFQTKETDI